MNTTRWSVHLSALVVILGAVGCQATPPATTAGTLIVLNKSDASATLLSLPDGKSVATIETGVGPHEVAITPDGKTAVVGNYGQRQPGSTLTVIDLSERRPVKTIELGDYHRPHGLAFLPDGKRLLVTAETEEALLIVDVEAGNVLKVIDTQQKISHMVALTPDGKRAFVANIGSGSVTAIDVEQGTRLSVISTGKGAEGLDISPNGREVWVANRAANTVSIVDTQSLEVVQTVECGDFPIRVKFAPNGAQAWVSNARSADVAVFDVAGREELRRIPMKIETVKDKESRLFQNQFGESPVPVGLILPAAGRFAYVANTNADVVAVIDVEKLEIVDLFQAGREPDGLGYTPLVPTQAN